MEVKRVFIFLLLVALCVVASSINLSQTTDRQYAEFETMAQAGDQTAAEFGYRRLAMKYPFTPAGISAAYQLVRGGESPVRLAFEILIKGLQNTTASQWLVFISAFLVITVFMGTNALPSSILILFVLSGAGMFHLSHPLVSVDSTTFDAILAANPYIYVALTLIIAAGYVYRRWEAAGQMAYHRAFVHRNITLSDLLQMKEIYSEKLKALQEGVGAIEGELQTAHGRHFVKEVKRVNETMLKELGVVKREMDSTEAHYRDVIQSSEEVIDRAKQELLENKIRYKCRAIGRKEYKHNRLEKKSILMQSKRRVAESNAALGGLKKVSFGNRLQFMRRDLFLAYLHGAFINQRGGQSDLGMGKAVFHPKIADTNIKKRKAIYRKSSDVGGKLVKLELRRGKMKESVYNARLGILTNEKKVIDKELMAQAEKIFEQMESCGNQIETLMSTTQALQAELEDMRALKKIRNCFPSHVRVRIQKIRQGLEFCQKTLPVLRKIEKIYSERPA